MKKLVGPIRQVLTLDHLPVKGALRDEQLEILTHSGILMEGEYIQKVGSWTELRQEFPEAELQELDGDYVALPGLVDCHTHLCFGGSRARDFALRNTGKTYLEIAQAGGGIWDTSLALPAVRGILLSIWSLQGRGSRTRPCSATRAATLRARSQNETRVEKETVRGSR
ncbi:hypothetical protein EBT25_17275 [bacterium]|nr:hypothetical protein [bacterium]